MNNNQTSKPNGKKLSQEEIDGMEYDAEIERAVCNKYGNALFVSPAERAALLAGINKEELEEILREQQEMGAWY